MTTGSSLASWPPSATTRSAACGGGRAASADIHLALVARVELVRGLVVADDVHQPQVFCGEEEPVEVAPVDLTTAGLPNCIHQTGQNGPRALDPATGPDRSGQGAGTDQVREQGQGQVRSEQDRGMGVR